MDDAQQIVLVALQQAGIELPDGVISSAGHELNSSALVSICGQAVNSLLRFRFRNEANGSANTVPTSLPAGTAERFRVCTDLANAVKVLGYRGDLSFHQFLYPSHKDTHKLLRFLLDQLSKSSATASPTLIFKGNRKPRTGTFGRSASTKVSGLVHDALTRAHGDSHVAEGSNPNSLLRFQSCPLRTSIVKTVEGVDVVRPTLVTLQAKPRQFLIPSLVELNVKNAIRVGKGFEVRGETLTSHGEFLPSQLSAGVSGLFDGGDDRVGGGEDGESGRDGENVALLQEQVRELQSQADRMEAEARALEERVSVLKEEHEAKETDIRKFESDMAVLREAVRFALDTAKSSPTDALEELREQVAQGEQHMAALQAEWETVRRPLEEKKAELERERLAGEGEYASKTTNLKEIRLQLQEFTKKLLVREEQAWTLEADLKEISSRPKRSSYVHRITELVKNSQKQETDIAKIITDTRVLQRDSNATNDRLRRTYALVDELVFRDAKKDPVCRQSYRQLTTIHETFADIVDKVLEMDKTGREIAELQAQLEELQKSSLDVQSVQADLDAVAIETRALERGLARVQASSHHSVLVSA